jgi:hypothetical protein
MMVRSPRVPVDLQAQTRFVKEPVKRAIAELEQIVQQTDPVFVGRLAQQGHQSQGQVG